MRTKIILFVAAISLSVFVIQGCKKDKNNDSLDSNTRTFHDDNNNVKAENDQVNDDINNALSNIPEMGGRVDNTLSSPMCGCTIDSTNKNNKIIIFKFDGVTPCFSPSRTRGGEIKAELVSGASWKDPGAVLKITYTDFKVTRLSNKKSITFNGVKTLTNVNGNDWLGFLFGTKQFKYKERAYNLDVAFSDVTRHAVWNSARVTTWDYEPATVKITFSAVGDTTINGVSGVDSWGTSRFGDDFVVNYNSAIVSNTYCGLWRPDEGELAYDIAGKKFTLTLGVNEDGNADTRACSYGYKISWEKTNGQTATLVLSY